MEKILLVEDSKPTIDLINTALTARGYKVAVALNGSEAVSTAIKWQPALILMDVMMPEIDGYEVCNILKKNQQTRQIPVVFLSALTHTLDKVKAFKAGAVDYLNKPIDVDELLARIHTHLTIAKLQNELLAANERLEDTVKARTAELKETNLHLQLSLNQLFEKTQALEESESRYKLLVNNIMYPVLVSDFEGNLLFNNILVSGFFGKPVENEEKILNYWRKSALRTDFIAEIKQKKTINNKEINISIPDIGSFSLLVSSSIIDYYGRKAILSIFIDITKQKQLEQQVLTTAIETEERERKRFAQELHDGLGPLLSAAKMYLQWITQTQDKQDIPNLLNKTHSLIDEAHKTTREISHSLSPHILQNFGLVAAIRNFVDQTKIAEMLNVEIRIDPGAKEILLEEKGSNKETILYRVLTESINNTMKHANADKVFIEIKKNDRILDILFSDNGIGFDVEKTIEITSGLGLFNMKHRIEAINGKFVLNSFPGKGTTIKIEVEI